MPRVEVGRAEFVFMRACLKLEPIFGCQEIAINLEIGAIHAPKILPGTGRWREATEGSGASFPSLFFADNVPAARSSGHPPVPGRIFVNMQN